MTPSKEEEIVVLLHGIGHIGLNMIAMEKVLQKEGYKTLNLTYPSLRQDIKGLGDWLAEKLQDTKTWETYERVHFVVHSMGGLVSGFYLEHHQNDIPKEKMGRVVMMGTPHGGSEVADFLQENPLYQWAFGPAGQELTTSAREEDKIKPWYELGIIAGEQDQNITLGRLFIDTSHDGVVSVESTKVDGMTDHKVMTAMHSFMAWVPNVQAQVSHFLEEGKFEDEKQSV